MKVNSVTSHNERRRIVAYLDSFPLSWDLRQERLASLRQRWSNTASAFLACIETQSAAGEELSALLPSVLRPQGGAFKGEL